MVTTGRSTDSPPAALALSSARGGNHRLPARIIHRKMEAMQWDGVWAPVGQSTQYVAKARVTSGWLPAGRYGCQSNRSAQPEHGLSSRTELVSKDADVVAFLSNSTVL